MPLQRRSELKAKTPLKRGKPLIAKPKKTSRPRTTGPDRATRDVVFERDGGCVVCGCGPYGLQVHHRKPRKMGGRSLPEINAPSNLLTLCPADHQWAESRREEALALGLLVAEHDDPAQVPLNHCLYGPVLLADDGTVRPAIEGEAA